MANVAYIRVSTVEQNEERQRVALASYKIDKIFLDKASAKDINRPELQAMLDYVRSGDTVYVESFNRLGRSVVDLNNLVKELDEKGVNLISVKENFDISTPTGRLQFNIMTSIAQFEREIMLERQREGIAVAKAEGKYKGRKEVNIPNFDECYQRYMNRQVTKMALAKELDISRTTLDKLIAKHKETLNNNGQELNV